MAKRYTDEFRRDAEHMATASGLTRPQLLSDLGVGLYTLNKWVQQHPLPGRVCAACTRAGNHAFNIAPNLLDQDFSADGPNQKCPLGIMLCMTLPGNG